jgi:signal transduction histidine kinase
MADVKSILSAFFGRVSLVFTRWWGGIGCRVSFFMMTALILVATSIGAFFFWEGEKVVNTELRGRALVVARELAALTADDLVTGNRFELYKKLLPSFAADEDSRTGKTLLYALIFNKTCDLLIGGAASKVSPGGQSYFYDRRSGKSAMHDDAVFACEPAQIHEPTFVMKKNEVCDLTLPILAGRDIVGYVRVGISGERLQKKMFSIVKKTAVALLVILLIGIVFSQIIVMGISKPILRLSDAIGKLGQQNWDEPFLVKGNDEISKLGHAFNQMALVLKQREISLSRGNRDLFILHTTGLGLMESLDRESLLSKIAAGAEDLVRADTTAVSIVDKTNHPLKYIGVFGSKRKAIKDLDVPLEAGGIYNWLASYGTPLLIADAQEDFRLDGQRMNALGIESIMTAPLWSSNTMTALLTVINKTGGANFDKHDLRLFTVFSNLASAALQNASLYSDLKWKMVELKTTQEQLVHSTKMAAIGGLSANIAHEINNPLTSVLGYTTHLLKTLDLPEPQRKILMTMEQETLRVRKIIRNLLDFSRQRPSWMQPGDISIPLKETIALVQGIADASSVVVHEDYPVEPTLVNMDHNEMKQVFINIVNNALYAMPQGGQLRVKVYATHEHHVVVVFSDSGSGIASEHMDKIFEPFFTTKGNGGGTGLGLSISYRIVQNHGGNIEAESSQMHGTTFRVVLPQYLRPQEA